jgi:hypothetical protein
MHYELIWFAVKQQLQNHADWQVDLSSRNYTRDFQTCLDQQVSAHALWLQRGAAQAREYDDLVVATSAARQAGSSGNLEFKFHEKELKNPTRLIHLITSLSRFLWLGASGVKKMTYPILLL